MRYEALIESLCAFSGGGIFLLYGLCVVIVSIFDRRFIRDVLNVRLKTTFSFFSFRSYGYIGPITLAFFLFSLFWILLKDVHCK